MPVYIAKRLLSALFTVWFLATLTFFAMHAVPGDPLSQEQAMSEQLRASLEREYGLDKPLLQQYVQYMGNTLRGDFGISYTEANRSVNTIIAEHFPVSALLGVLSVIIAAIGAVTFGALSAYFRGCSTDTFIMLLVAVSISVPGFVFAALAQLGVLAVNRSIGVEVLPIAGWGELRHMLLPALVLGLSTMAFLVRLARSSFIEVIAADYVRTARAKGLGETQVFLRHVLPNAALPMLTVLGPAIAAMLTGGFVVELIFSIPGLGRYFVQAVQALDYTVIMGTTVFYGGFLVLMVLLVDLLYGLIDPRIRLGQQ
jgi:ABC-type dipeptide/oligopeptide/nickel transport system permease component